MKISFSIYVYYSMGILLVVLGGCARYQVTLNEQPIYSPPPLFSQFEVADDALKNCLRQTIADLGITRVDQLKRLICRHAGIASVQGLEIFTALEELDLSHNALRNLKTLQSFSQLHRLQVNDNPDLLCDTLPQPGPDLQIISPVHCSH